MKISKTLLKAVAVAVTMGAAQSCAKEKSVTPDPELKVLKKGHTLDNCPVCGMG
jgi:hypothetical protein